MKIREQKELHTKTTKELWDMIKKNRLDILDMELEISQNKLKNTTGVKNKKHDIARMLTILREKELKK